MAVNRSDPGRRWYAGTALTATAVLVVGLLAAGCVPARPSAKPSPSGPKTNGVDRLPVARILDRAMEASTDVSTVRVAGVGSADGLDVRFDVRVRKGKGGAGYVADGSLRLDFIRIGKVFYLKGDRNYWRDAGGPAAADAFAGRWAKTSVKNPSLDQLIELTDITRMMRKGLRYVGGMPRKGEPQDLRGRLVLPLVDRNGAKTYIALTGEPRLVTQVDAQGRTSRFHYDKPFTPKRPPAGKVVELGA